MKNKAQPTHPDQEQVRNPHDRFLKHTLEDPRKVKGTLEGVLPPKLFARLNLSSLQKEDTSYIDSKLKQFFSDIVFSCRTKDDIPLKIAFLFEHKSYPPKYPHLQLLRYMLEIWDREVKEEQPLSLILPILIYHGKEAWTYRPFKNSFSGEIDSELVEYVPLFDFLVVNFQAATYAQIDERFKLPSLRIAFRLMKSIRDEDLSEKLGEIFEGLSTLEKDESERKFFQTIIVYLYYTVKKNKEQVMEDMYQISLEADEYADSIAMDLIRKGREEAREEAKKLIEEERRKAEQKAEAEKKVSISKMLKAKMQKEIIADFLGLTLKKLNTYIQEIEKEEKNRKEKKT
ncbi:MAG: Rpn family recombination-promoting nuclease/putative transposase [Bacteroidetes bacterium]|nr:Rpn family recombination-promoting nuclease/putative transposase [Bacteroidota bacterium]